VRHNPVGVDRRLEPWRREAEGLTRAFAGAFLFGIPLLMTMEMWRIGAFVGAERLLGALGLALLVNLGLAHISGFKDEAHTVLTDLEEAVEALAVGAVASAIVLLLLNQIAPGDPLRPTVGRVVLQTVPLSIGASLANAVLFQPGTSREGPQEMPAVDPWRATIGDFGATAIGAAFISFNIAPTEEVPTLAIEMSDAHVAAAVLFSLVVTYAIVFESSFGRHHERRRHPGLFQRPLTETTAAYLVSLLVAFVSLAIFERVGAGQPLSHAVAQTVVLGIPASIGGAAGRLVV
jgi:putative integral membrane protein (TIGR02587 family)